MDGREIAHDGDGQGGRADARRPVAVVRHLARAARVGVAKGGVGRRTTGGATPTAAAGRKGRLLAPRVRRPGIRGADDIVWCRRCRPAGHAFNATIRKSASTTDLSTKKKKRVARGAVAGGNPGTRRSWRPCSRPAGSGRPGQAGYVVMRAELDAVIVNGPMRGKQHTYALVSERAPAALTLSPEAALAELTWRFFATHGPATVKDFVWWSSLTVAQIKAGLALVGDRLTAETVEGKTVWFDPAGAAEPVPGCGCFALTEDVVAYRHQSRSTSTDRPAPRPLHRQLLSPIVSDARWWASGGGWVGARTASSSTWATTSRAGRRPRETGAAEASRVH